MFSLAERVVQLASPHSGEPNPSWQACHDAPHARRIYSMAKDKVTISLDRLKAETARNLVAARSTSDVIDIALDRLIRAERIRRDVEAYKAVPQTAKELALSDMPPVPLDDDDIDWDALYADT